MTPNGWKSTNLGYLYEFKNGYNTDKSNYGHGLPFVNVSEVLKHESLTEDKIPGLVNIARKEAVANSVKHGDVLFNRTSETMHEIGFTSVFLGNGDVVFGGFVIRGRPKTNEVLPDFAKYYMRMPLTRKEIIRRGQGAVRSNIGQTDLAMVPVLLPPIAEQKKIAEILDTWDKAIEVAEKQLENVRSQKRALMQQLLTGKCRFSEFEGQEWRDVRFEDIFDRVRRKNTVGNENTLTISGQDGLVSQQSYFNKRVAAADLSGYTLLTSGDFAYNKSYSAGYPMGAIKVLPEGESGVVSSLYLCFTIADQNIADRNFFRHFFEAGCFNRQIYKIAQEGARNHGLLNVSVTDFFRTNLTIPSIEEQQQISRTIGLAEDIESSERSKLNRLRTEKKALMQQLLTGKKRVTV